MFNDNLALSTNTRLSAPKLLGWRIVQFAVWLAGATILYCLLFSPSLGILLFWNILIPVAPALLVIAAGLWRNICPLATTALLPRHFDLSKRKKLQPAQLGKLNFIGVMALYIIVPLRHAIFNNNGPATGLLLISMIVTGVCTSFVYEWKSAWCSGLCPIHPVEKLYGGNVVRPLPNAHCDKCMNCVIPCPDSTPHIHPRSSKKTIWHKLSGWLIIGGLPGFIWGWFHVPDATGITSLSALFRVYALPMLGLVATLAAYGLLSAIIKPLHERRLISIFAALGVSCYYWYRIPELFGFGMFEHDGLLLNLKGVLPEWSITATAVAAAIFFFYWLVIRKQNKTHWLIRPAYAGKGEAVPGNN
jgi:hypothetical protein